MTKFTEYPSTDILNLSLAQNISQKLAQAIDKKGQASLVVSGGQTPIGLFSILSQQTLDWNKVAITLADERWVDVTSEQSNENLIRRYLLTKSAARAKFISLKNDYPTADQGEKQTTEALSSILRPFDVVLLGMGEDGHTASLFPKSRELYTALDMHSKRLCIAITSLDSFYSRITMTLPTLLHSKYIYLHFVGEKKYKTYKKAQQEADVNEMPVRAILDQIITPVEVVWAPSK